MIKGEKDMKITLKDGVVKEFDGAVSVLDIAKAISFQFFLRKGFFPVEIIVKTICNSRADCQFYFRIEVSQRQSAKDLQETPALVL